ncbi:MAG: hypothetical protein FD146_1929 [Anaerolineaceae bacterium]|nr:MAG: hypothetical protein FD146_1929 [Anaerolineaceae bacterium]
MTTPTIHSVVRMLEGLPQTQQEQAAAHLRDYLAGTRATRRKGKAGKQVLKFAGTISKPDLKQMQQAIEAGCEQVDGNEW